VTTVIYVIRITLRLGWRGGLEVNLHVSFNLSTRCVWVVRFTFRPPYPGGEIPSPCRLFRWQGRFQSRCCRGDETRILPPTSNTIPLVHFVTCHLLTAEHSYLMSKGKGRDVTSKAVLRQTYLTYRHERKTQIFGGWVLNIVITNVLH
jgi:hypothetical protein